jgi:MATE family multidrug resistance protein
LSINKEIFRIAIPNIIANISIPLLGIVDTALMGRMEDSAYIGAIALGGIIFNILYWGFGFLRPGTTGLTAQALGRDDKRETAMLLFRSFLVGISIGFILLFFHVPIGKSCFKLLSGGAEVENLAYQYFSIRIWGAPVVIAVFAMRGWLFGVQDAISPMILTIIANVTNIICSWYLVMIKGMSVQGVALGTVIAQYLTFFVALAIIVYKHRALIKEYIGRSIFKLSEMHRFFQVNRDMFIRNIGLIFVFTFFTNHASTVSNDYLAISQILLQLFYFMSYAVDGFAYASESLVGKYLGMRRMDKVKLVIRQCLIYGLGFGFLFTLAYSFFGAEIIAIFTDNRLLIDGAKPYFIWLSIVAVSGALAFIWDGVYSGGTANVEMRDSMILSVLAFIIVFYIVDTRYPLISIWAGMIVFMLTRSIVQIVLYYTRIESRWMSLNENT